MKPRFNGAFEKNIERVYIALAILGSLALSANVYAQTDSPKDKSGLDTSKMAPVNEIKVKGVKFKESWPKNFPLPKYPKNVSKTTFAHTTEGDASASANLITSDKPATVYHWYKNILERDKWKVNAPEPQNLGKDMTVYFLDAVKGHNQVTINIINSPTNQIAPGTSCSINWTFNRK